MQFSGITKYVRCPEVKMKKWTRMLLCGFVLVNVQERRFEEGDEKRNIRQQAD